MIRNPIGKPVLDFVLNDDHMEEPILGLITKVQRGIVNNYFIEWVDGYSDWYQENGTQLFLDQIKNRKSLRNVTH